MTKAQENIIYQTAKTSALSQQVTTRLQGTSKTKHRLKTVNQHQLKDKVE